MSERAAGKLKKKKEESPKNVLKARFSFFPNLSLPHCFFFFSFNQLLVHTLRLPLYLPPSGDSLCSLSPVSESLSECVRGPNTSLSPSPSTPLHSPVSHLSSQSCQISTESGITCWDQTRKIAQAGMDNSDKANTGDFSTHSSDFSWLQCRIISSFDDNLYLKGQKLTSRVKQYVSKLSHINSSITFPAKLKLSSWSRLWITGRFNSLS